MPQCLKPQNIRIDTGEGYEWFLIPCLKCNFCLQDRRNGWAIRLHYEWKRSISANFLTLTYNNESMPTVETDRTKAERWRWGTFMTLDKKHLTKFHDALWTANRRFIKSQTYDTRTYKEMLKKYSPKFYSVGEYGSKDHRPHYHVIVFNLHPKVLLKMRIRASYEQGELEKGGIWNYGHVQRGEVNNASIAYTAKYLIDKDEQFVCPQQVRPFAIMSKGLGDNYLENKKFHIDKGDKPEEWRLYIPFDGKKYKMPRYYKDKIFSPEERQQFGELGTAFNNKRRAETMQPFIEEYGEVKGWNKWREQREHEHELIRIKSKKLNKL